MYNLMDAMNIDYMSFSLFKRCSKTVIKLKNTIIHLPLE